MIASALRRSSPTGSRSTVLTSANWPLAFSRRAKASATTERGDTWATWDAEAVPPLASAIEVIVEYTLLASGAMTATYPFGIHLATSFTIPSKVRPRSALSWAIVNLLSPEPTITTRCRLSPRTALGRGGGVDDAHADRPTIVTTTSAAASVRLISASLRALRGD